MPRGCLLIACSTAGSCRIARWHSKSLSSAASASMPRVRPALRSAEAGRAVDKRAAGSGVGANPQDGSRPQSAIGACRLAQTRPARRRGTLRATPGSGYPARLASRPRPAALGSRPKGPARLDCRHATADARTDRCAARRPKLQPVNVQAAWRRVVSAEGELPALAESRLRRRSPTRPQQSASRVTRSAPPREHL